VIQRRAALLRSRDVNLQVLLDVGLPDKIGKALRAQRALDGLFVGLLLFFASGH